MGAVKSESSVVTLMDRETLCVRLVNSADHVEMNSVSTELEGLTDIHQLDMV